MRYKGYAPKKNWYICESIWVLLVSLVIAFLFYNSIYGVVLVIPYSVYLFMRDMKEYANKQKTRMTDQLRDVIICISNAMQAGYSAENAVGYAIEEIKKTDEGCILDELLVVKNKLAYGEKLSDAIVSVGKRTQIHEFEDIGYLLETSAVYGGNVVRLMKNIATSMQDKRKLEAEIATLISAKKLEGGIMLLMPFLIMLYLRMSGVTYTDVLYNSVIGHVFMTICMLVIFVMGIWQEKIISVEIIR